MTSTKIKQRITDLVYTAGVANVSRHGCRRECDHCALGVVARILTVVHENRANALGITFARGQMFKVARLVHP
jgi:hypothetical protein